MYDDVGAVVPVVLLCVVRMSHDRFVPGTSGVAQIAMRHPASVFSGSASGFLPAELQAVVVHRRGMFPAPRRLAEFKINDENDNSGDDNIQLLQSLKEWMN